MAKWKRTKVGSVCIDKDDKSKSYIKFSKDFSFKDGDCLSLESKKEQLESLNKAIADGKLHDEQMISEIRERIEKIPEFVRFEMIDVKRVD